MVKLKGSMALLAQDAKEVHNGMGWLYWFIPTYQPNLCINSVDCAVHRGPTTGRQQGKPSSKLHQG